MNTHSSNRRTIWLKIFFIVLAIAMYGFFGLSFVVAKDTLKVVGPFFLTGVRMLFASALILGIQLLVDRKKFVWPKGLWFEIGILSLFNICLTNVLEFWGLQYMSCYKTCYIYSLSPFLAALISFIFLKERLGKMKILGLTIAFVGFAPLLIYKESSSGKAFYISAAEWALLGAAISTVIGWVAMRKVCYQKNYPPLMANGISMFLGGLLSFVPSFIFEGVSPVPVSNWSLFLKGMVVMALINNVIGYNLYAYLVRKFTVTLMAFIGFITPLITALLGWVLLKEPVSLLFFLSYAVVLLGFFFFSREEVVYDVK